MQLTVECVLCRFGCELWSYGSSTVTFKSSRLEAFVRLTWVCYTLPRVCHVKELLHCDFSFIMSSTFVADTTDDHKSDNTLIIIVNNDGTVSVDQETLQNLIGKFLYCNLGAHKWFYVAKSHVCTENHGASLPLFRYEHPMCTALWSGKRTRWNRTLSQKYHVSIQFMFGSSMGTLSEYGNICK